MKTDRRRRAASCLWALLLTAGQVWASSYVDQIKANGPVFYWRLGERTGTVAQDASGNGATGTYVGAVSLLQYGALTNADFNTAIAVSANGQHVDAAESLYTLGDVYSIEAFGRIDAWNIAQLQYLFGRGSGAAGLFDSLGFTGAGWGGPKTKLAWFNGSDLLYGTANITNGVWYHVVAVRSNASVTVYLNGALDIQGSSTIRYDSDNIIAGNRPDFGVPNWIGCIDEVAVYNYALTPAQVQADYQARLVEAATSYKTEVLNDTPVFYWRLGETGGTVAQDAASGSIPGAYVGSVALGQPGALTPADNDRAVTFSSNSQRVDVDNALYTLGSNYTLEAFIKASDFDGSSSNGYQYAFGRGSSTWEACGTSKNGGSPRLLYFYSGGPVTIGSTVLSADVWYHVVFVRNDFGIMAYLNGAFDSGATKVLAPPYDSDDVTLGIRPDFGGGFHGCIDEFAVYDYPLSPLRIRSHYEARTRSLPPRGTVVSVR
ncbi:MAG: LamG domain-containing protein [Kiritimatiellae bacterium]|nr:LamG domain-containing protein [Kiritimatiellia bacterium]